MSLLNLLAATQPAIPLPASAIRVLDSPAAFYSNLVVRPLVDPRNVAHPSQDIVRRAKRRIFLSSLYLSASEHHLVRVLPPRVRTLLPAPASVPRHCPASK